MRVVMTLLVRDEADVVEANLRYHLGRGIDFVIATDNASTDGTTEILERFEAEGVLRLIREPAQDYRQAAWRTRMARLAATEHGADWVFNSDADEFWWPRRGTLKDVFETVPRQFGALAAPLVDFVPRPDSAEPFYRRMTFAETEFRNRRGQPGRTKPKMAHRGVPEVEISSGNHKLLAGGLRLVPGWEPILVFHFPLRSYAQFERKVSLKATNPTHDLDKQRADLVEALRRGELRQLYEARVPGEEELRRGLSEGSICEDPRLKDFMERLEVGPNPARSAVGSELGLGLEMWRSVRDAERRERLDLALRAKRKRAAGERQRRALAKRRRRERELRSRLSSIQASRWWRLGAFGRRLLGAPRGRRVDTNEPR
jgi:Glycosyl transferase family 2